MGFVEGVGVTVAAAAVLALAGAVTYWLFGVVVDGTVSICTSRHFVAWSGAPDFDPHLDIGLEARTRFGQALTIREPEVHTSQQLHVMTGPNTMTLPADGAVAQVLLVMVPPKGEPLRVKVGERVTVVLPLRIGHKTLRLKVAPRSS
jgi:hypothetical protein